MATKTLIVSRADKLYPTWKKYFGEMGYGKVEFTGKERDGLLRVVNDYKPDNLLFGCGFYSRATPYLMPRMLKKMPTMNVAAVNIHEFPDDLGAHFIINGVDSYVNMMDGMEEFNRGMKIVMGGGTYVAEGVSQRLKMRREIPEPAKDVTDAELEVLRLTCGGFGEAENAETLQTSRRTIVNHKASLYRKLNVRNSVELIIAAILNGFVKPEELNFYPKDYTVKPLPVKGLA